MFQHSTGNSGHSYLPLLAILIQLMTVDGCFLDYSLSDDNDSGVDATDSDGADTNSGGAGTDSDGADTGSNSEPCGCPLASWTEDSQTDFLDNAPLLQSTVVTSSGSVTPEAYRTGGLLMTAYAGFLLTHPPDTKWDDLLAAGETGRSVSGSLDQDWNVTHPLGLGIATSDNFTLGFAGEIELERDEKYTFHVSADDGAFFEIFDGVKWRRASALTGTSTHDFTAPRPGWYPIRIGIGENTGLFSFSIQYSSASMSQTTIPSSALRIPLSEIHGLEMLGFDRKNGQEYRGAHLDTEAINHSWEDGRPAALNLTESDEFAVRWIGQVHLTVPGEHHFRLVTDDGQRLWINGELLLNHWDDSYFDETAVKKLTAGWHDLVVDVRDNLGTALAQLSFGPSSIELADTIIPVERFRPAIGANESTTAGFSGGISYIIPDPGEANYYIHVPAPIGNTIQSVDVCFELSHDRFEDLILTLYHPDRTPVVVQNHGPYGSPTICYQNISDYKGKEAAGTWRLKVEDDVKGNSGLFKEWSVVVHHQPNTGSIWDPDASYISQIFDAGKTVDFTTLIFESTRPTGASVKVSTRSAIDTETLLHSSWSSAVSSNGAISNANGRYFQYQVTFSPGRDQASFDHIEVQYCPCP